MISSAPSVWTLASLAQSAGRQVGTFGARIVEVSREVLTSPRGSTTGDLKNGNRPNNNKVDLGLQAIAEESDR